MGAVYERGMGRRVAACPHCIREERAIADRNSLEAAQVEAAIGNRILAEVGLAAGVRASLGHVSMRVPGDPNLFVTPSGRRSIYCARHYGAGRRSTTS